jgi:hypothetical protein
MSSSTLPVTPTELTDTDLEGVAGGKEFALLALNPKGYRAMTPSEEAAYFKTHNMEDVRNIFRRPP